MARALIVNLPTCTVQDSQESTETRKNINRQRRTALTLRRTSHRNVPSFLVSVFCNQHHIFATAQCVPFDEVTHFLLFAKWLQYCNSAMNPMVYAFRDDEMRKTFVRLLGPCRRILAGQRGQRVAPTIVVPLRQTSVRLQADSEITQQDESQL